MRAAVVLLLLVATAANAKIFKRCELAKALKAAGMDGFAGATLADWVCLVKWESNYNTKLVKPLHHASTYGLFQLSSEHWCDDGQTHETHNVCKTKCSAFLSDNIQASITCAKRVVRNEHHLGNWKAWIRHCMGQDLTEYTKGCRV
ncbi:lysozyme C II-like [Engraulis encrasicolus]|uniref:lysozyme C II-like n=1 Tax=Engraulis encrasicolus TaxID=184585 RepID=UPI002FD7710B